MPRHPREFGRPRSWRWRSPAPDSGPRAGGALVPVPGRQGWNRQASPAWPFQRLPRDPLCPPPHPRARGSGRAARRRPDPRSALTAPRLYRMASPIDAQQSRRGASLDETFRVAPGNFHARLPISTPRFLRHVLVDWKARRLLISHLLHDLLPGALVRVSTTLDTVVGHWQLLDLDARFVRWRTDVDQRIQQRPEHLDLPAGLLLIPFHRPGLELGEHVIYLIRLSGQLLHTVFPRLQLGIAVRQLEDRFLELDEAPDPELVPVVVRIGLVQMVQRSFVVATIVQNVGEIDPRLDMIGVQTQRGAKRDYRRLVLAQPVLGIADARHGFGIFRRVLNRYLEKFPGILDHAFPEQGAADLKHQIEIVGVAKLERSSEAVQRGVPLAELEQGFTNARKSILVVGIQDERLLKGAAGPRVFLTGVVRVSHADVKLHSAGIECQTFAKYC